ncbi:hypothetical protein [Streptomyces sp. NPDC088180]|uniref:hypothetical protein n=1 Tax=Streptomyces sp. NPDC088180 TaxID=3365837 RepID=UPI0037F27C14
MRAPPVTVLSASTPRHQGGGYGEAGGGVPGEALGTVVGAQIRVTGSVSSKWSGCAATAE